MATLFDTVRQNLNGGQPQQTAGVIAPAAGLGAQDSTSAIQRLSSAATGKAGMPGSGSSPRLSNLAEQVATNQAQLQSEQVANQSQIAAEQVTQQEKAQQQERQLAEQDLDEASISQQEQYSTQAANLLRQFENNNKQLDVKKDAAKLEQLGFNTRMSDDKYVTQLQGEGRKARLDKEVNFQDALNKSIFEDEMELFNNDLQFRTMMRAKGRDFESELAGMDLDFAMKMAQSQNEAANSRLLWGSIGSLASAGISAGASLAGSSSGAAAPSAGMPAADAPISTAPSGSYWSNPGKGVA